MLLTHPARTETLIGQLLSLWKDSVRASHTFLNNEDIEKLSAYVIQGISHISTLVVVYDGSDPAAFMGIESSKIEMLFVSADRLGKGIGSMLVRHAIEKHGVTCVDVNEQNISATAFYRRHGFEAFARTPLDEQGNPFPILKMRLNLYSLRQARKDDLPALQDLFRSTVLVVNRQDYTQAEVEDWASCGENLSKWEERIKDQYFIVAEDLCFQITGFSSIDSTGYLDLLFVHKDFQHRGIATMLLREIEQHASDQALHTISSEVSITARPFFEQNGYTVGQEQKRKANQLCLTNFQMFKQIV